MIKQDANVMALVNVLAHSGILRCKQRGIYPKGLNADCLETFFQLQPVVPV